MLSRRGVKEGTEEPESAGNVCGSGGIHDTLYAGQKDGSPKESYMGLVGRERIRNSKEG